MKNFLKKRSFLALSLSDILGNVVLFPSTCYIQWWLANGWRGTDLAILSVVFAFALAGAGTHEGNPTGEKCHMSHMVCAKAPRPMWLSEEL